MRLGRRVLTLIGVLVLVGSCSPAETGGGSPGEPAEPTTTSSTLHMATTTTTSTVRDTTTTSTVEDTTTTTVADWEEGEAEAALAAIDDFYAALNSGDVESAYGLVVGTPGSRLAEKLPIAIDGLHAQFEYECTLGSPGNVGCVEYVTDDLYGPAGITNHGAVSFFYYADKLAMSGHDSQPFVCEFDPTGDSLIFLMEFRVWAAETHPELERYWFWGEPIDTPAAIPCTVYPFNSSESAGKIGEIVPEFVAQSADWPVDSA